MPMIESKQTPEIELCFLGKKLYGDDFTPAEVEEWFKDEADAYYNLEANERHSYLYGYHALNSEHGFSHLPEKTFRQVLGMGKVLTAKSYFLLCRGYPRSSFWSLQLNLCSEALEGIPLSYVKPQASGNFPFADGQFDLITCLGVLHHIPNVSMVVQEMYRCLAPNWVCSHPRTRDLDGRLETYPEGANKA